MICQFSPHPRHASLAAYIDLPGFYPAGRLDTDSEGLVLLCDDGALQYRIADPSAKLEKRYQVQVEGLVTEAALIELRRGLDLGDFVTRPCKARRLEGTVAIAERNPPIRQRKNIPTSWLEVCLTEGKNRQVRRMTAKVGFPTLRLLRCSIGPYDLCDLAPGQWREVDAARLPGMRVAGRGSSHRSG